MKQQPSGSAPKASYAASSPVIDDSPVLSSHRIDRLLVEPPAAPAGGDRPRAIPMHGIWLGAGFGVVLWVALVAAAMWLL